MGNHFFSNGWKSSACSFGIFVNGTLQDSTRSGIAIFMQQQATSIDGDAIISLLAGDVITVQALIPTASGQNDIPSARPKTVHLAS
jgi:hypothetical protein